MPEQSLSALEFPGLIRVMQHYAVSTLGRSFLASLKPLADLSQIQQKFHQMREWQELENREGAAPLDDFSDLAPWLAKATVRGSLLHPEAFNEILQVLVLSGHLRHYLKLTPDLTPHLARLAAALADLSRLKEAIQQCISPHNFILDQASPGLAGVRRELSDTREQINRQIKQSFFRPEFQDALQNPIISQRHGRYVIPLKADHKGAIPGIIHDQSQTKATLFLEPLAIVEHNNAINLLLNREQREEEAVLRRLTDLVRNHLDEIRQTLTVLAELDAIGAKVAFARDFKAREPIWRSRGGLDLKAARHPLLVQRHRDHPEAPEVVPIDLALTPEQRWLIISGANAGGKTVALKTLGLLALMVQSGIPIPVAEGSEFCPFDNVYADIGDPQNLQQNLSTFSAHLHRALDMLNSLAGRDLILLDELGTATDPTEGGALALALLQVFYQRGAYGAATTHIPLLKSFAQRTEGFENVAVVFNEQTRRPTYQLAYGVVGASNALKIARELGLSPEILAQAERYLDQDELRAYRLLGEVEAAQQEVARRETELTERARELAGRVRELEEARREVAAEHHRLEAEVKQAALARIKEAEVQFKEIVKRLKSGGESWGRLRQEFSQRQSDLLQELTPTPTLTPPPAPAYAPGQKVFLPALGLTGEILARDNRDGRLEVQVRQVKIRVTPEEVAPAGADGRPKKAATPALVCLPPRQLVQSLNVIGLRVDEALPLVDRLLDQAVLNGAEHVDIIHGVGTGRLKKAVWEHLRRHGLVQELHADDNPGVTVVDLKD
ncbi:MAG: endonuclease MutS2 [Deltaproteobacteria bacterium]|nr:endonuclease MutS2 [Deltaproteobacteria bacterium]